jgi:hypothetical protein
MALLPSAALAADMPKGLVGGQALVGEIGSTAQLSQAGLPVIVGNIINVLLGFLGIVLLGYLLYAGFLWMTAGGEEENVTKAKSMIKNSIIGLVIIVAAFAISSFVLQALVTATAS